jgi:hypothetical protein
MEKRQVSVRPIGGLASQLMGLPVWVRTAVEPDLDVDDAAARRADGPRRLGLALRVISLAAFGGAGEAIESSPNRDFIKVVYFYFANCTPAAMFTFAWR